MEIIKDLLKSSMSLKTRKQSFLKVKEYKEKQRFDNRCILFVFSKRNCSCHGSNSCGAMFLIE